MVFYVDGKNIDTELIRRGLMRLVPLQIRLERHHTDAELEENARFAETHTCDEIVAFYDAERERISAEIVGILDLLERQFTIGQYKNNGSGKFDLWFSCGSLYQITGGRLSGLDYSRVTLTLSDDKSEADRQNMFWQIQSSLETYPAKNVQAIFLYSQAENEAAMDAEAKRICESCAGRSVRFENDIGKLSWTEENGYTFRKKHRKAQKLDAYDVCVRVQTD